VFENEMSFNGAGNLQVQAFGSVSGCTTIRRYLTVTPVYLQ
jgi:hypothetical protein